MSVFTSTMTVDPSDTTIDFTALEPAAAAEVQTFAADVASSYAGTVAATLGVDSATVSVSCLYRQADEAKLNLLTLNDTCTDDRLLLAAYASDARRLAAFASSTGAVCVSCGSSAISGI